MRESLGAAVAGCVLALAVVLPAAAQPPATPEPTPAVPAPPIVVPGQPVPGQPPAPGQPPGVAPEAPAPPAEEPPPLVVPPAPPLPFQGPLSTPEDPVPSETPTVTAPPSFFRPDLFHPPPHRGWLSLTPSLTLSEEFVGRDDEKSDFITALTPGITLSMQRPRYRLLAGYNLTAEFSALERELSFAKRQRLFADGIYRVDPRTTVTLTERFVYDRESQAVTAGGVSSGRNDAWRNTLTGGVQWQATPLTSLRAAASHSILRFEDPSSGASDSDTYRVNFGVDRQFTGRLRGSLDLETAYFDADQESPAWTTAPRLGASYQITPTLRASASAGPLFVVSDGESEVMATAAARLQQIYRFGSLLVGYDRTVSAETSGPAERQSFYASLQVPGLVRGLRLAFTPRYSAVEWVRVGDDADTTETHVITAQFQATYQIAPNISIIGAYTFNRQWGQSSADELSEHRVFFGLQYAYPINFF